MTSETSIPPYVVTANPATEQAGLPSVPNIPPDPSPQSLMTGETGKTGETGERRTSGPSIPPDPTVRAVMTPGAGTAEPGSAGGDAEMIEQLRDD